MELNGWKERVALWAKKKFCALYERLEPVYDKWSDEAQESRADPEGLAFLVVTTGRARAELLKRESCIHSCNEINEGEPKQ